MNLFERYDKLKLESIKVQNSIKTHKRMIAELQHDYESEVAKMKANQESLVIQESSINTMKEIIDKMSSEHIERVVNLLSYALQVVFFDKDYSVELVMGDKRNSKTAEFYLVERRDEEVVRTEFNEGIGGGVLVVVGFVLQVFYLQYLKLSPIMFCDESFSQLSDIYIPYLKEFIHQLSEKMGFIFVLITHDSRLVYGADRVYQVEKGNVSQISESQGIKVVSQSTVKEG